MLSKWYLSSPNISSLIIFTNGKVIMFIFESQLSYCSFHKYEVFSFVKSFKVQIRKYTHKLRWKGWQARCVLMFDIVIEVGNTLLGVELHYDSVFPSVRPSKLTWENDNFTKFHMQLYWLIPHTFCFMTFDLRGHIRPLRLNKNTYTFLFFKIVISNIVQW